MNDFEHDLDASDLWPLIPRFRPIPTHFHSLEFEGPFTVCMICNGDLNDFRRQYCIERIFHGTEPIVEYAMCLDCQQNMTSELSAGSLQSLEQFFSALDHEGRIERLRKRLDEHSIDQWIDECLITGKRRVDCRGYQIMGLFQGPELHLGITPFMFSAEGAAQLTAVLSKQTRERLHDFMGDQFGMPPEFCERPDFFPVLLG